MTDITPSQGAGRKVIPGYRAVEEKSGKSRQQIWRDIRAGTFPAPMELGPNSVGWFEDEIDEWLASRPRRTYRTVEETSDQTRANAKDDEAAQAEARRREDDEEEEADAATLEAV